MDELTMLGMKEKKIDESLVGRCSCDGQLTDSSRCRKLKVLLGGRNEWEGWPRRAAEIEVEMVQRWRLLKDWMEAGND